MRRCPLKCVCPYSSNSFFPWSPSGYFDLSKAFTMSEEANSDFLGPNFTNMKLVGTGGSGAVYSAIDVETDQRVALKRLILRDQMNCRAALREIKVLKTLEHENIVKLSKVVDSEGLAFQDSATENFKEATELFLVEELLDSDLHHVLQSKGKLREDYVKLFLYQLLRGLKYVHSANVVHRDVKPSNILVDAETLLLRIGDFGRSRILDPAYSHNGHLTHSISSLWYKSPELLLNSSIYDSSVDMWAAGCVFAEMLLGKPLFEGRHEIDQMELILNSVCLTEEEWTQLKPQIPEKTALGKAQSQGSPLGSKFLHIDIQGKDRLLLMARIHVNIEIHLYAREGARRDDVTNSVYLRFAVFFALFFIFPFHFEWHKRVFVQS